ncbi:MAG: arylesterase [Bryobacteraceae bacterium]|nr:arylesterase [Bryobacteraceae bacterium]
MRLRIGILALMAVALLGAGCSSSQQQLVAPPPAAPAKQAAPAQPVDGRPVIVAFGDSLTAGYGVAAGLSYPDYLQKEIDAAGYAYRVVNMGISGDTTSGGVNRMEEAVMQKPEIVILELGGNDGLRGLPLEATRQNLDEMAARFQSAGAKVLLAGMTLPRNYGPDYIKGFESIYVDLARQKRMGLIPFLLEGVATEPRLMQGDAIHPTAEGNRRVAATVFRYLKPMLN